MSATESILLAALGAALRATEPKPVRPLYVLYDEFLTPLELEWLGNQILAQSQHFRDSQVITQRRPRGEVNASRRSQVMFTTAKFAHLFLPRLERLLPRVARQLGVVPFSLDHVELQVTASRDGDYFKTHTDNQNEQTSRRIITFVYYAHREPVSFSGGELRFYLPYGGYADLTPKQNSIVFFTGDRSHAVLPVQCPTRSFADSRITINGWLWRK